LVIDDVRDGLLTPGQARARYGVVADARQGLDVAATAMLRGRPRPAATSFAFGPERQALDARWPPSCRAALARGVMAAPAQVRSFLLESIVLELDGKGGEITQARVERAVHEYLKGHTATCSSAHSAHSTSTRVTPAGTTAVRNPSA
jgi:hypothetical protein